MKSLAQRIRDLYADGKPRSRAMVAAELGEDCGRGRGVNLTIDRLAGQGWLVPVGPRARHRAFRMNPEASIVPERKPYAQSGRDLRRAIMQKRSDDQRGALVVRSTKTLDEILDEFRGDGYAGGFRASIFL
jgi:hypothetical protein